MFEIGFSELVLVGILALLVLGPKRLPEVARAAGSAMAKLRRFITNVKQDFDRELHSAELAELRQLKSELDETRRAFTESGNRLVQDLATAGTPDVTSDGKPLPEFTVAEPAATPAIESKKKPKSKKQRKRSRTHGRRTKTRKRS
jgi:sec-independent protein translocase protein TatB